MSNLLRPEMAEGTYVFESFPTALTNNWQPYRPKNKSSYYSKLINKASVICPNTEYLRPTKKPVRMDKFRGGYLESDVPAVAGRLHVDVQTDLYLEELVDHVELIDKCTQTDDFLNRPASPFFIPKKWGIDNSTQIEEGELFDFDLEVRSLLEVLVSKTIEQSLLEVMEEEELANIRCELNHQGELRAAYLNEIARREEQNRRYREEFERRYKEARELLALKQETVEKITLNQFVTKMLEPLMPDSFENLYHHGYFKDPVKIDLETFFMPELLGDAMVRTNVNFQASLVLDGMIRDAVNWHQQEHEARL